MKLLIITLLLIATTLSSAEIIPIWHTESGAGDIQDMELLKGGDQFIVLAGEGPEAQIQIRNTEDGELVRFYTTPISTGSKLQITPDSTRVLMINGSFGQLRLLDEQFTIINSFNIESDSIKIIFNALAIDPIRPIVYLSAYGGQYINGKYQSASKILACNYETGQHVKDLTEFGEYEYTVINVSNDGKYFASINEGEAYLKVWDLETMEVIKNVQLYDESTNDNWCEPKDIQFSRLNNNVIYYSGRFPFINQSKFMNGIMTLDFLKNEYNNLWLNNFIGGKFTLMENESIIINYNSLNVDVFNLNLMELIKRVKMSTQIPFYEKTIFANNRQVLIGSSNYFLGAIRFDNQSVINSTNEEEIIISPNPTNSFVNIEIDCVEPLVSYQINDINGVLLYQNTIGSSQILNIDFTSYPIGTYLLTVICNNQPKSYKIIKEG